MDDAMYYKAQVMAFLKARLMAFSKAQVMVSSKALLTVALLALTIVGCDSERLDDGTMDSDARIAVVFNWDGPSPRASDALEINSATFSAKELVISVSYSGGCKEHSFTLYTSNHVATSYPAQVSSWIVHDGQNDGCKAYITETLSLDFAQLIDAMGSPFILHLTVSASGEGLVVEYPGS